jgi:IclR family acetate operon transcriptional repressor
VATRLSKNPGQTFAARKTPDVTQGPRSLARILGLLDIIARTPDGLTLASLNTLIGAPKSSLLMLLRPLVAGTYLVHEGGRYLLGPASFQLASTIQAAGGLPRVMRPWLEKICAATGETVFLAALDEDEGMSEYIDGVQSPQAVKYWVDIGARRELYAGSAGKVFLAWKSKAWRERYLDAVEFVRKTPKTIMNKAELRRQIERVVRDGYAVSRGEAIDGAAGMAAPVFDKKGKVIAAIVIGAPDERFGREMDRYRKVLLDVCARIAEESR